MRYHLLLLIMCLCAGAQAFAQARSDANSTPPGKRDNSSWLTAWSAAPQRPRKPQRAPVFYRQSLRQIIPIGIGGDQLRVRFSNVYGTAPLRISRASVALHKRGSVVQTETVKGLKFDGRESAEIEVGEWLISDPVVLNVTDGAKLAVSLYLPGRNATSTYHRRAFQDTFVSEGDTTHQARVKFDSRIGSWFWLTGVDVRTRLQSAAIVVLGDSISDGYGLANRKDQPWPDVLQRRLRDTGRTDLRHSVLNLGIGGNRLLNKYAGFGDSLIERFDRDVVGRAGVKHVIVQIGINDIGLPVTPEKALSLPESVRSQVIDEGDLIAGFTRIIELSHRHRLKLIATTILPYRGAEYFSERGERVRQAINDWIRREPGFDGVIDFDAILRDPNDSSRLAPKFDSGDHLHPTATGLEAMASAIDLEMFSESK